MRTGKGLCWRLIVSVKRSATQLPTTTWKSRTRWRTSPDKPVLSLSSNVWTRHSAAEPYYPATTGEDWRVGLSTALKEPTLTLQKHFQSVEGQRIELPERFSPDPNLMQRHRDEVF